MKRLGPSEAAGEKNAAREEPWDQVTGGLVGLGQAFAFYSKFVGNHWEVLSRVFYIFIFPSMCVTLEAVIRNGKLASVLIHMGFSI